MTQKQGKLEFKMLKLFIDTKLQNTWVLIETFT